MDQGLLSQPKPPPMDCSQACESRTEAAVSSAAEASTDAQRCREELGELHMRHVLMEEEVGFRRCPYKGVKRGFIGRGGYKEGRGLCGVINRVINFKAGLC